MSILCEQPVETLYNICILLDEKSLICLGTCSWYLRSTLYETILKHISLEEISAYPSEEEALNVLSVDRSPLSLYRWSLYLSMMSEESLTLTSNILLNSLSIHQMAMGFEIWRQRGYDASTLLVSLVKDGGKEKIGAVRYLLSLYDWIGHGSSLSPLLREHNLYGMLYLLGEQDDLHTESPDSFHYLGEHREFTVPSSLQPGFYLASEEIMGKKSCDLLFWESSIFSQIHTRIYYQRERHSVPDPVYRYSSKVKSKDDVTSILYFDDLDLVRGMKLFCQTIEMEWSEVCIEIMDHLNGKAITV